MSKKAIIFDLDNTIYSVHSIGDKLFATLFQLIMESGEHGKDIDSIKNDIMRKPFQVVAAHYNFSKELTQKGIDMLKNLTYQGPIKPFSDYQEVKYFPAEKFLVTRGFLKLQQSKIAQMGIEKDFKEIHIVDPETSDKTKKDVFTDILTRNNCHLSEVLVVGDDPNSEIKAAKELGIDAVLYDKNNYQPANTLVHKIVDFKELSVFF